MTKKSISKPRLKLTGRDGNAFVILGKAKRAADKAKWSPAKWQEYETNATSSDYDNLLRVTIDYFEVE